MSILKEKFKLINDYEIPKIGFGTWQIPDGVEAYQAVSDALKVGYRHIDTAFVYKNEESVGKAIKDSDIDRKDIFITSKLPSRIKSYHETEEYFNMTLENLDIKYIDLYLIHAPWPWNEIGKDCRIGNAEAWKKMIELYNKKKIKAIGVSNFNVDDLKDLIKRTGFVPHVNQIPFFVGIYDKQKDLLKFCEKNNILVQAYSPLVIGKALKTQEVVDLSNKYSKTPAQILIQYCLQNNTLPLPKTLNFSRMKENSSLDFRISDEDMMILKKINHDPRRS